jgi:cobalt-zinc-cadmium efflux system outer membrane protein
MSFRFQRRASARLGLAFAATLLLSLSAPAAARAQAEPPALSLSEALARASAADPTIAGSQARLAAAEANLRQAGVKPNPTLGVDLENFAGTGAYSLLDRTEATLSYQQTLERGGKREARTGRARAEIEVARLRRQVRALDLMRDVQIAYAEATAAEAELLIAEAKLIAAHQAQADIDRRVKSARDPLFAGSRADMMTAQAEIARDQARDRARNARAALARFWSGEPDFRLALEPFFDAKAPALPSTLTTPDFALLEAERDVALANVRVEQARAVPDPTLRAGVRYLGDGSNVAFVIGGTIPLQRHDTNRGAIERAQAERTAAEADIAAARVAREREIAQLTARISAAAAEAERIRAEVIPPAIRSVEQVREGFNRGGFQYLDVTEAERALAEARARRVSVLRQYHVDQAALDRLTGRHAGISSSTSNAERR